MKNHTTISGDIIILKPKIIFWIDAPLAFISEILVSIAVLVFGYIGAHFMLKPFDIFLPTSGVLSFDLVIRVIGCVLILNTILTMIKIQTIFNTEYYLKKDRISFKRGSFSPSMNDNNKDIFYKNIIGISTDMPVYYKKFNVGSLRILEELDKDSFKLRKIVQVDNPRKIRNIIEERRKLAGASM